MSKLLSKRLKDQRGIYAVLTALNAETLEEMIADAEELEKTDCHCSAEETTGWTTFRLCNICGKIQAKK